jgi:hypothetical protein
MHLHSSSYPCTLVRSVCSVYLVLGKDPVNDYGKNAPPLILQSTKLKIKEHIHDMHR